jgi:hypothetical protein
MKAPKNWTIPSYDALQVATGTYEPTYFRTQGKSVFSWGRILLDSGPMLAFTCNPGVDEPNCAYSKPYNQDKNIGKRMTIRYFDWPNRNGPGNKGPEHVIMELRGSGAFYSTVLWPYRDSVVRLEDFREKQKAPSFIDILFFGTIILALPGILYRIFTGREASLKPLAKPA